jgi:RNA ligase (TIGR02306 family)
LIEKYNLEYLKKNGRTSTVKLRGYLSEGLILDLPEGKWKLGDNVAENLGITKYEPPEPKFSVRSNVNQVSKKKLNPYFDKYTEIENIKNYKNVFNIGDIVVITEKIHGCNSRFGYLPIVISKNTPFFDRLNMLFKKYILKQSYEWVYGSHNVQITNHSNRKSYYGEDVWGNIAKKYNLANKIPQNMIVYGEVYGEGIQDLTYGLKGVDLVVFDIKLNSQYLNWNEVKSIASQLGLKTVPELFVGELQEDTIKQFTNGQSILYPSHIREGCVVKMLVEESDPRIGRKILKSISEEYLLRKNATEYK